MTDHRLTKAGQNYVKRLQRWSEDEGATWDDADIASEESRLLAVEDAVRLDERARLAEAIAAMPLSEEGVESTASGGRIPGRRRLNLTPVREYRAGILRLLGAEE